MFATGQLFRGASIVILAVTLTTPVFAFSVGGFKVDPNPFHPSVTIGKTTVTGPSPTRPVPGVHVDGNSSADKFINRASNAAQSPNNLTGPLLDPLTKPLSKAADDVTAALDKAGKDALTTIGKAADDAGNALWKAGTWPFHAIKNLVDGEIGKIQQIAGQLGPELVAAAGLALLAVVGLGAVMGMIGSLFIGRRRNRHA